MLGVGLNSLFHANMQTFGVGQDAKLVVGEFANVEISEDGVALGEEYFVQMDTDSTSIVGTIWPSNDPSKIITVRKQMPVRDSRPVFFGDFNTLGIFHEVIVSKSPLPIGGDLVLAFSQGTYNDNRVANSSWSSGDWDADGEFDSADLIVAFQDGGYGMGSRLAAVSVTVPEPAGLTWLAVSLLSLGVRSNSCFGSARDGSRTRKWI